MQRLQHLWVGVVEQVNDGAASSAALAMTPAPAYNRSPMTQVRPNREMLVARDGIDHHAADMTATFGADVTLAAAQNALARHGQWLPIDGEKNVSLGELVSHNSTGPLRLGYG